MFGHDRMNSFYLILLLLEIVLINCVNLV